MRRDTSCPKSRPTLLRFKSCACGHDLSLVEWLALPSLGVMGGTETKNCPKCLSTIGVDLQGPRRVAPKAPPLEILKDVPCCADPECCGHFSPPPGPECSDHEGVTAIAAREYPGLTEYYCADCCDRAGYAVCGCCGALVASAETVADDTCAKCRAAREVLIQKTTLVVEIALRFTRARVELRRAG